MNTFFTNIPPAEELVAVTLCLAEYALAAMAVGLAVIHFRRCRRPGWLLLAAAFSSPFATLLLRAAHGQPLFRYKIIGPVVSGAVQVTYRWEIPNFYLLVVIGLLLLMERPGRDRQG